MSGYLSQVAANFLLSVIMAYAAYMPLAIGQLNLGVAGFIVLGAYASAIASTKLGLPLPLCVLIGTSAAMFAGFLVALSVARMDGIYFSLATFAFAEVVVAILVNIDAIGAANGYVVPGHLGLGAIAAATAIVVVTVAFLMSTRVGLIFTAVRNDERAAAVFGVGVPTAKVLSMVMGGAFAGLAGALYGHHYSYIEAQNFNFLLSANAVLFVLLGGLQTWWGPLLGAGAITVLPEVLRTSGEWRYIVFGAIMVVLMVWRPEGLLTRGLLRRFRLSRA
jgi:branched-chain amino acid transport system permease protein